MQWNEERIILANPDIISENHLPPEIHARDTQMKEIAICIRPITESRKPVNCCLHGKPGVGKTSTARWINRSVSGLVMNDCLIPNSVHSGTICIRNKGFKPLVNKN